MMLNAAELLGVDGPFARGMQGFTAREQQQSMADAVHRAIDSQAVLVCEAGTGTGKTFAYLCPVLVSGRRTIISTGTKTLQAQLYARDLPAACAQLGIVADTALLKGRSNYLCIQRLRDCEADAARARGELRIVSEWAALTTTGDIAECVGVAERSALWPRVTSTVDNCLGVQCRFYDQCHVLNARRAAMQAEIVVVNHHLFFADMVLREEGFGELLPGAETVVFDEAHQLAEIATRFFGISLSASQLRDLVRDTRVAYHQEAGDMPSLLDITHALDTAIARCRLALEGQLSRVSWSDVARCESAADGVRSLREALDALAGALAPMAERGQALDNCQRRAAGFGERFEALTQTAVTDSVQWVEVQPRGFQFFSSPLDVAESFSSRMHAERCAWVFTSATLAIGGSLDHFAARLGLVGFEPRVWESPFDFARQSLCYLPEGLPDPVHPDYTARVVEAVAPVLRASEGRAFVLFTSHSALGRAAAMLAERTTFPLLVQGAAPRDELLRRFRSVPRAVLLGTSSFWEGVDVKGDALACVIIEKLPFAVPDDPVLKARARAFKAQGRDPFREYQLPQAVIALKQGVGRLIRDEADRGVLVLCDPRLTRRGYGKVFLESLPPFPLTRDIRDVERFFGRDSDG